MSEGAKTAIAVLDANVLYPFRVRDALLHFAHNGLYKPCWSQQILDEWTKNLLKNKPELAKSIHSQLEAIGRAFPDALFDGFEGVLSEQVCLPDEGDRHVIELAIKVEADYIVTENLKDFPDEILKSCRIQAISADHFLVSNYEENPKAAMLALRKMRGGYKNPKMSVEEFKQEFRRVGLVETEKFMKQHQDIL